MRISAGFAALLCALIASPASATDQDPPPPGYIKIFKGTVQYGWNPITCPTSVPEILCPLGSGFSGGIEVIGSLQTMCDGRVVQQGRIYPVTSWELFPLEQC